MLVRPPGEVAGQRRRRQLRPAAQQDRKPARLRLARPGLTEPGDERRERQDQCFAEQPGLGPEVAEQQIFGDAGGLRDLAGGGAALVVGALKSRHDDGFVCYLKSV